MKNLLNNFWFMTVIVALFSAGVLASIAILNSTLYLGTFNLYWIVVMCILSLPLYLVSYLTAEEKRWTRRILRIVSLLAPITAFILFQMYKPVYTVQSAINKIEQTSDFENVQLNEKFHLMSFTPKANPFVSTGYVLSASKDNQIQMFIFNPVSGQFDPIAQ